MTMRSLKNRLLANPIRSIIASATIGLLLIVAVAQFANSMAWQIKVQNSQRELSNLANSYAAYVALNVENTEELAKRVRTRYEARVALGIGGDEIVREFIPVRGFLAPFIVQIAILDRAGGLVAGSLPLPNPPPNFADRPHFRHFSESPQHFASDQLHIGQVVTGRVSKRDTIQATLPLRDREGQFNGVVVISLDPAFFRSFFRTFDLRENSIAGLAGIDGYIRSRVPNDVTPSGPKPSVNTPEVDRIRAGENDFAVEKRDLFDGVYRFYHYKRIEGRDLFVIAGTDIDALRSEFASFTRITWAMAASMAVLLLVCAFWIGRHALRRERLLIQMEMARKEADRANQATTRLMAVVSHELRTPLNGISGFAHVIRDGAKDPDMRDHGDLLCQAVDHLRLLVNQILEVARSHSGRRDLVKEEVNLPALLESVTALHRRAAIDKGLTLHLNLGPGLPSKVLAVPGQLRQILDNLLNNAIKFTHRGGVELSAKSHGTDLVIEVIDSGIGIAEARQSELFDYFSRIRSKESRDDEGAGLGLALTQDYVQGMGGDISLTSTPGQGTRITIRLPAGNSAGSINMA